MDRENPENPDGEMEQEEIAKEWEREGFDDTTDESLDEDGPDGGKFADYDRTTGNPTKRSAMTQEEITESFEIEQRDEK